MATLFITEYAAIDGLSGLPTGNVANQVVPIGASTSSAIFNVASKVVRLEADAVCSIAFGTAPVAGTTSMRMAANLMGEYFTVNGGDRLAVIANS